MQRALQLVLVALLIASAGCIGDTSAPGDTPERTSDTATSQVPPGVSEAGVENVSAILDAHQSYLQNRSFTARFNRTTLAANGSVVSRETGTIQVGKSGATLITLDPETRPGTVERWFNDTMYLVKQTRSNDTTYQRRPASQIPPPVYESVYSHLEDASVGKNTTTSRVTRNGRQLFRVQGLNYTGTQGRTSTVSMLVGSQGVIWEYKTNTTYPAGTRSPNTSYNVYNIRIVSVNESAGPNRPAWVQTAINRTTPIEHGRQLRKALDEHGLSEGDDFEYRELEDEGHYSLDTNQRSRRLVEDFLNRRV